MGSFLEKQHGEQPVKHVRPKKRKTVKKVEKPKGPKCKDIRNFFQQKRIRNDENNSSDADITVTVTID